MTYPKAILFSAIILAAALIFAALTPLSSQMAPGGAYMIAGNSGQFVWRLNTQTGAVSYCVRRDNSLDPGLLERRAPYCSAPSPALK